MVASHFSLPPNIIHSGPEWVYWTRRLHALVCDERCVLSVPCKAYNISGVAGLIHLPSHPSLRPRWANKDLLPPPGISSGSWSAFIALCPPSLWALGAGLFKPHTASTYMFSSVQQRPLFLWTLEPPPDIFFKLIRQTWLHCWKPTRCLPEWWLVPWLFLRKCRQSSPSWKFLVYQNMWADFTRW